MTVLEFVRFFCKLHNVELRLSEIFKILRKRSIKSSGVQTLLSRDTLFNQIFSRKFLKSLKIFPKNAKKNQLSWPYLDRIFLFFSKILSFLGGLNFFRGTPDVFRRNICVSRSIIWTPLINKINLWIELQRRRTKTYSLVFGKFKKTNSKKISFHEKKMRDFF